MKEFIKSSRVGGKAILHRGVPMADSWCWSTGMVVGEGREGRGWKSCAVELHKVAAFEWSISDGRSNSRKFSGGP